MGIISSIFDIFGKGPAAALKKANARSMEAQTKGYNEAKGFYEPYREAGNQGLSAYKDAVGLGDGNRAIASFENSPFYKLTHNAALNAGQEGVLNQGYGAGTARSGQTLAALADRARQDTNNSFQSYVNPLAGFTDAGLSTAGNLGNLATGHATNQAEGFLNKGKITAGKFAGFDSAFKDAFKLGAKALSGGFSGPPKSLY